MPKTFLVCTECKHKFLSTYRFNDREAFETTVIRKLSVDCPNCKSTIPIIHTGSLKRPFDENDDKENMVFED